jgi:hypothetical protein
MEQGQRSVFGGHKRLKAQLYLERTKIGCLVVELDL